jgi:hypothetical protein
MTTDTKTSTPPTQTKGESAVRHLWKQAIDDGDEAKAKTIAVVANLLAPSIKLAAGSPATKTDPKATVNSAEIDGSEVDLRGMEPDDAEAYAEYVAELDGSARLARHIAQMEADDAEDRRLGIGAHNDGG